MTAGRSWGPGVPGFAADLAAWSRSGRLRVGDAERESAVSALGEHFAAGRLTHEEFDERSTAAWSARTAAELTVLFADLPRPHVASPVAPAATFARRPRRARFPFLPALALSAVVAILTPVPFLVVLLVAWLAFVSLVRPVLSRGQDRSLRGWTGFAACHPGPPGHTGHTRGSRRAVRGTWS